jgi:hypothetical protein
MKSICSYKDRKTNVRKSLWEEMMKNGLYMKVGQQKMKLLKGQKKITEYFNLQMKSWMISWMMIWF